MNGSHKQLQQLLERVKAVGAEQQDLIGVLLEATWWVKDELQRQSDICKKHEERLQALETKAKPLVPALSVVAHPEVKPEPAASAAAAVPCPPATAPDSDLLELGLDLFADLKKQAPAAHGGSLVEEMKATPDPLMQSDPWRDRLDMDIDGKAASSVPIGSTRTVNKAAVGARPHDDAAHGAHHAGNHTAPPSRPAPKAMPVEIAQQRGARVQREAPSQSLRENLDKVARSQHLKEKLQEKLLAKVVEKESRQETVAALAAKAQTLMGDEGPPGPPPAKAAPEGKSPEAKSTATAAVKASGSKPPAKAPPVALLKRAESDAT